MAEVSKQSRKKPGKPLKTVRIAVPCFGEEVAPCFHVAHRFRVWELGANMQTSYQTYSVDEPGLPARIKFLRNNKIDVLICNGIQSQARELLIAEDYTVIENVMGSIVDALYGYLAGKLRSQSQDDGLTATNMQPHTADLVAWTEELFHGLGWEKNSIAESKPFPIDLIFDKACPVCGKLIRIAVCCGAHAYRVENEIREFRHVTNTGFNGRVYVHYSIPKMDEICRDYEIELLDPTSFAASQNGGFEGYQIAPLSGKIIGHNKINIKTKA